MITYDQERLEEAHQEIDDLKDVVRGLQEEIRELKGEKIRSARIRDIIQYPLTPASTLARNWLKWTTQEQYDILNYFGTVEALLAQAEKEESK